MPARPLTFRDFHVEMTDLGDDGTFKVRVIGQTPGGEMPASAAETVIYRRDDLKPLLNRLAKRRIDGSQLLDLGEQLAGLLLPGRVGQLLHDSLRVLAPEEGLRVRLRIEPLPLAALPWEYTYLHRQTGGEKVPADFLALQRNVSITRYETIGDPVPPLAGKDTLRVVVALAEPLDQERLDLAADRRAIEAALAGLRRATGAVEVALLEHATRDALHQALTGADVFHFAGHGIFDAIASVPDGTTRKRGKLVLENAREESDFYDSAQLAVTLGNAGVRLAVLGACQGAARDDGGAWTGVAPALVRRNLPAVVAMQYDVLDDSAGTFMAHFYTRVFGGYTVDEAVFEGRQAVFAHSDRGLEDRDWGVPVLYLRAQDGFIFPVPPADPPGTAASPLVQVQQKLGTVRGEDIGADIGKAASGRIEVRDEIGVVEEGGKTTGVRIDTLGG